MPDCSRLSWKTSLSLVLISALLTSSMPLAAAGKGSTRLNRTEATENKSSSNTIDWKGTARAATEEEKIRHLLNRITYGPGPDEIERVKQIGIDAYLDEQLNPQNIPQAEIITRGLSKSPALKDSPARLFMQYGRPAFVAFAKMAKDGKVGRFAQAQNEGEMANQIDGEMETRAGAWRAKGLANGRVGGEMSHRNHGELAKGSPLLEQVGANVAKGQKDLAAKKELQSMVRDSYKDLYGQVTDARLMRAVYSPRQFEEVMTDFWFNHFNVSIDKGLDHLWVGSYEEQAIRPHVLGRFRDLLGSTAHHACMLFYLDNWQNTAPKTVPANGPMAKRNKFSGLNENYARELMELHTLGVDGGYTQKDVQELARVLTGWGIVSERSIRRNPQGMDDRFGFNFDRNRHDFGDKVLLGTTIKGKGEAEVEEALDILAKHPSTAKHVSYQLAQYFVADQPPASLVDKMASTFTSTGGDIKAVMKSMLASNEFWDTRCYDAKFKTPYRYLISTLRASGATLNNSQPLLGFLRLQGMPLYQCQTPDGYKNTETAWLNSSTLLQRINFATALGSGRLPAAQIPNARPEQLMQIAGVQEGSATANVVTAAPRQLKLSLLMGSPEFMKH